jgi:hypothetical protein
LVDAAGSLPDHPRRIIIAPNQWSVIIQSDIKTIIRASHTERCWAALIGIVGNHKGEITSQKLLLREIESCPTGPAPKRIFPAII